MNSWPHSVVTKISDGFLLGSVLQTRELLKVLPREVLFMLTSWLGMKLFLILKNLMFSFPHPTSVEATFSANFNETN